MFRFLDRENRVVETPEEWSLSSVEVMAEASLWQTASVWLQERPLEVYLRRIEVEGECRARVVADIPRLGPGPYVLRGDGGAGKAWEEEFTVHPSKISVAAYEHLIDDLEARLPTSIALGLQRAGALAGVRLLLPAESTRAQELTRLRRAVDGVYGRTGLAVALPRIGRDPHRMLRQIEPWVRVPQARRPAPGRLISAVARVDNLSTDRRLHQVLDARVEHTVDVYENRVVKVVAMVVDARLRRLMRVSAGDAIAADAETLLTRLEGARAKAPFLAEVTLPSHLPQTVTMALLKRPEYRAVLEAYLELRESPRVGIQEPLLDAPLVNLPRLYQLWGTLEVCDALLCAAAPLGYRVVSHRLLRRDRDAFFVRIVPDGQPAIELRHAATSTIVSLVPERSFGSSGPLRSTSFTQRPDVTVEVMRDDGTRLLYLFDPKYKLDSEATDGEERTRPVKSDIDKMHAYRDSIRDAHGHRVVRYAGILYPGEHIAYSALGLAAPEIEAIHAYPGKHEALSDHLIQVLTRALGTEAVSDTAMT